ncbi:MAG TPA: hypothetical protein DCR44_04505 [Acholeplasmatales bacterium]|nr:hypothetical protein [Acholeplasmatales bacterium]
MSFDPIRSSEPTIHRKPGVGMWVMPINQLQDFYDYSKEERSQSGSGFIAVPSVIFSDIDHRSDEFGLY